MKAYKRSIKNFFIDKHFQTKYMLLTIILLLSYTLIFSIIIFLPSILTLYFNYPLSEQTEAARTLLVLNRTVWPTVGVVILIFSTLSIFITHKIAGPIYRLKLALSDLISGKFCSKIHLRKWDDLQELAEQVNHLSDELHNYTISLKTDHEQLSNHVKQLEESLNKTDKIDDERKKIIEIILNKNELISETLKRF